MRHMAHHPLPPPAGDRQPHNIKHLPKARGLSSAGGGGSAKGRIGGGIKPSHLNTFTR